MMIDFMFLVSIYILYLHKLLYMFCCVTVHFNHTTMYLYSSTYLSIVRMCGAHFLNNL
uniref:Uncharacterized protein n=1 Tax=Triticum urartu TaxID=4572 RepID=A0A8R7V889_TRIUA